MLLWFGIFSLAACCNLNITVYIFFNYFIFFLLNLSKLAFFLPAGPLILEFESNPRCRLVSVPSSVSLHILVNSCSAASLGNCTPCWGTTETKAVALPSLTWWAEIWT